MITCYNCFKEKLDSEETCPHCGYTPSGEMGEHYYLPTGTVLNDRYKIGRVLGHGGFGITYVGYDERLQVIVAIKEYLPSEVATRALGEVTVTTFSGEKKEQYDYGLGRFLDEARTLARYNHHPCIVSTTDFFETNNTAYLVMEFLDGIPLNEYLKRKGGKISWDETLEIMMPVMDALREVHSSGMIHRDISPDNIYITKDGQVKLLDFGAARFALGEKSKSLSVVLKPGYAPPEQYSSRGKQGPWTDVYAVAATMYRMVAGKNLLEAVDRYLEPEFDCPEGIEDTIFAAMEKALAVKGEDRYQSIEALQKSLVKNKKDDKQESKEEAVDSRDDKETVAKSSDKVISDDIQNKSKYQEEAREVKKKKSFMQKWTIPSVAVFAAVIIVIVAIGNNGNRDDVDQGASSNINNSVSENVDVVDTENNEELENVDVFEIDDTEEVSQVVLEEQEVDEEAATEDAEEISEVVVDEPEIIVVTVPALIGMSEQNAIDTIADMGLSYNVSEEMTADYSVGTVFNQSINEGQEVETGSTISITVATEMLYTVPNLVGKNASEISGLLGDGISYSVSEIYSDSVSEGVVISQSVNSGTAVQSGTNIEVSVSLGINPMNQVYNISDPALEEGIRLTLEAMGETVPDQLTKQDVLKIRELKLTTDSSYAQYDYIVINSKIQDISSLSGLMNMEYLGLPANNISDISSLSGLTNLTDLYLQDNNISDISSLSGLTNLEFLWLYANNISDMSSLSGLTNLENLWLYANNISDISSLSGLTNLGFLVLDHNNISDISSLSGLTNLYMLFLYDNIISDTPENRAVVQQLVNRGCIIDGNPFD